MRRRHAGRPVRLPRRPTRSPAGTATSTGPIDHSIVRRQQYAARSTFYEGNHEIKVGGDYQDGQTDASASSPAGQLVQIQNEYGQLYYAPPLLRGEPRRSRLRSRAVQRSARVLDYGAYVQDSWRVAPGLTINAGLRWDGEQTRQLRRARPSSASRTSGSRASASSGIPWNDGATKVYAFAGRFSYALPTVGRGRVVRKRDSSYRPTTSIRSTSRRTRT